MSDKDVVVVSVADKASSVTATQPVFISTQSKEIDVIVVDQSSYVFGSKQESNVVAVGQMGPPGPPGSGGGGGGSASGFNLVKDWIESDEELIVPIHYQFIVDGSLVVDGSLIAEGKVVIL